MSENDTYRGPAMHSQKTREATSNRLTRAITRSARQIHARNVLAWVEDDDADYPSSIDAKAQAHQELEVLLRAMGRWAAVDPGLWDSIRTDARPGPEDGTAQWEWDLFSR